MDSAAGRRHGEGGGNGGKEGRGEGHFLNRIKPRRPVEIVHNSRATAAAAGAINQ